MDMLWYGHKYGFVPDEDFDTLWNRCSVRYGHPRLTTGTRAKTRDGWKGDAARPRVKTPDGSGSFRALDAAIDPPECVAAHRRFLLATSDGFSQTWRNAWMNDLTLYGPSAVVRDDVPGTLDFDMASWMRRADVRAALHVEESPAKSWPGPDDGWTYTSQWGACNEDAAPGTPSMVDFYRYVAPRLPGPTIVFNGYTDPCVSSKGPERRFERLVSPVSPAEPAPVLLQRLGGAPGGAGREAAAVRAVARGPGRGGAVRRSRHQLRRGPELCHRARQRSHGAAV